MGRARWVLAAGLLLACLSWCTAAAADGQLVNGLQMGRVDAATVRVFALAETVVVPVEATRRTLHVAVPEASHGSGVLLTGDGLVLTAFHVVDGARVIVVMVPGHEHAYLATPVYGFREEDYALLAISGRFDAHIPFPADPPSMRVRQTVDALGYPIDATRTQAQSSRGIIAGRLDNGDLQLNMSVNPGNSGGPLIDEQERLLGIVVAKASTKKGYEGIALAVPLSTMRKAYDEVTAEGGLYGKASAHAQVMQQKYPDLADVVSRMVQMGVRGMFGEMREVVEGGKGGELRMQLRRTLEGNGRGHADALTLGAAYYWNLAAMELELQRGNVYEHVKNAKALGELAQAADRKLASSSHFLRYLRDARGPASRAMPRHMMLSARRPPRSDVPNAKPAVVIHHQAANIELALTGNLDVELSLVRMGDKPTLQACNTLEVTGPGGRAAFRRPVHSMGKNEDGRPLERLRASTPLRSLAFVREHAEATVRVCGKQLKIEGAQFRLLRDFVKRACFYSSDPQRCD